MNELTVLQIGQLLKGCNDRSSTDKLLQNTVDSTFNKNGENLITLAAKLHNVHTTKFAIDRKVNLYSTVAGKNALQIACLHAKLDCIMYLLEIFDVRSYFDFQNDYFTLISKNIKLNEKDKVSVKQKLLAKLQNVCN